MLTRLLVPLAFLSGTTILLTGAWFGAPAPSAQKADAAFVPQVVPLNADIIGSGVDAQGLLQQALERLDGKRLTWMKTKIRQTMNDVHSCFVAEGFLQRGPGHCARLEMDVTTNGVKGKLLAVSDGELFAQVRKTPGEAPIAFVEPIPAGDADVREKYLSANGCGGPLPLLTQFQQHLHNARMQTGLLAGNPVIQIKGELNGDSVAALAHLTLPAQHGHVYLDAKTLWPCRIDWWGMDNAKAPRLILRIEFLEPELGRELSPDECAKLFSYQPEGNERIEKK